MAEDAVALTQQLNTLTESLDSVMDKMKEMLRLFGRIDSRGGSALRGLNTQSRNLNDNFRQIVERMGKLSTPATTVGAAATSQALGALTGQGGGGGGGGFGGMAAHRSGGRDKFADSMLNPLTQGLPAWVGAAFAAPGKGIASVLKKRGYGGLSKLSGGIGGLMGHTAAATTGMGLGAASSFIKQAYAEHHGLELGSRYLSKDIAGKIKGSDLSGEKYGYSRGQSMALMGAIQGTAGGTNQQQTYLGKLAMTASLRGDQRSGGFRVDPGDVLGLAGTIRAGGHQAGDMTGRILGTMADKGFRGHGNTPRVTNEYLSGIQSLLATQVGSRGRLSGGDEAKAFGLMDALSRPKNMSGAGLFDPAVGKGVAQGLLGGIRSPGGGAAGQIAVLQAMGFGNPNMDALNSASKSIGGPGGFERTDYVSALMMQEEPLKHVDRLLAQTKVIAGDNPRHQAMVLNQMTGIGIGKAYDVMTNATDVSGALKTVLGEKMDAGKGIGDKDNLALHKTLLARNTSALRASKGELVTLSKTMTKLHKKVGSLVLTALPALATSVATTGTALSGAITLLTSTIQNKPPAAKKQPAKKQKKRK